MPSNNNSIVFFEVVRLKKITTILFVFGTLQLFFKKSNYSILNLVFSFLSFLSQCSCRTQRQNAQFFKNRPEFRIPWDIQTNSRHKFRIIFSILSGMHLFVVDLERVCGYPEQANPETPNRLLYVLYNNSSLGYHTAEIF